MTTEKLIDSINKYLSLTRYGYGSMEKLSRLEKLQTHYMTLHNVTEEKLKTTVQVAEQLSGKLKLPLKVRGVFLTEGRPKAKYYTAEELELAAKNEVNKSFRLMYDHKDTEVGAIIGMVDKIKYDPKIRGIRWWGHINNFDFAMNVLDGAITEVSATIWSNSEYTEEHGLVGTDLTFKELSLVMDGAEKNNYVEPY